MTDKSQDKGDDDSGTRIERKKSREELGKKDKKEKMIEKERKRCT